jgi:hypothetical protein
VSIVWAGLNFGRTVAAALLGAALVAAVGAVAADAPGDWQWRPLPADACPNAGPERVLEAYMGDDRQAAGSTTLRQCGGGEGAPAALAQTHLRFVKHFSALPDQKIVVDHQGLEWRDKGRLLRASAYAQGDGSCGGLLGGECKFDLAPALNGGWLLRRSDAHGTEQVEAVAGVAIDDFWSRDQVTAPELANLYSGRLWRIATRSGPEADSVGGRAALRYRMTSEPQGFVLFRARFARVIWFSAEGEVLRACNYQQDVGVGQVTEFVRKDLGIEPGHDCARWLEFANP